MSSSLQGDPSATDGGTILSFQHTNKPRPQAETGGRASRGLFPKGMLMAIPIFVLAMFNIVFIKGSWDCSDIGGGGVTKSSSSNVGDEKGSDSNDGGFVRRVRNPPTTDASPLCTEEQMHKIAHQLMLKEDEEVGNTDVLNLKKSKWPRLQFWLRCPKTSWIDNFYAEETDIGSSEFLGISVGCNKGHDAIRTARMGLSDATIDAHKWSDEFHSDVKAVCGASNAPQFNLISSQRKGEMHCIEPMPSTFSELQRVDEKFDLTSKGVVFTHAAISSTSGVVKFPNPNANVGVEWLGIKSCKSGESSADVEKANCVEVPMFSLEDYVAKYVKGSGPINILQIDVEGNDFDVLFGAGSVLDSTHYLEFEYAWDKNLHIQDAVKLLDGKGFTCYWSGENRLWRISGCYFDHYNFFHMWSNVACVHRSQKKLYDRMEKVFTDLLEEW